MYTLYSLDRSFGERPLVQFSARAVERWSEQHPQWKPGTRHTYLSTVRVFVVWLAKRRVIAPGTFDDIAMPRKPKPAPRPIAREDIARLLAVAPDSRALLVITLQWSLGLRCIGVSNLLVEDIDFIGGTVTVREKYGQERRLPLLPEVRIVLDRFLAEYPATSGPLLRSRLHPWRGLTPAYVGELVARWMVLAGVKAKPGDGRGAHALRHSCLTEVAEASPDPWVLAELAGWADISTASYYVRRASTDRVRAALEAR